MAADELGERLRAVRALRGYSLRQTAKEGGISAAYLQKLERGEVQTPSPNVLYAVASFLEVPYSELMRLAGYVVPNDTGTPADTTGGLMTHALSSEDLTEAEATEVAKYLAWWRQNNQSTTKT